jgi:hypothetical protein
MKSICDSLKDILDNPPCVEDVYRYWLEETDELSEAELAAHNAMKRWVKKVDAVLEIYERDEELRIWRIVTRPISTEFEEEEHLKSVLCGIVSKICSQEQRSECSDGRSNFELFVDEIESFQKVSSVLPQHVRSLLPLTLSEDKIQNFLEEIIGENFHLQDWGGEMNDLVTSYLRVEGERLRTAFLLKGHGTQGKLTIAKCGKNGDQIVRLVEAPVELYVIQHVDQIDQRVVYDLKSKIESKHFKGEECRMCIMDGTDTARVLKAYGKI